MSKYRISYEPKVGSTVCYCVEKKGWFFWHYVDHSWCTTEEEAKQMIDKLLTFVDKPKKIQYP